MEEGNKSLNLERLLRHLHAKKNWLDTMITSLEAAVQSADHRFIQTVTRTLGNGRQPKPKVDLQRQQRLRLARLAAQVRGGGSSRQKTTETS